MRSLVFVLFITIQSAAAQKSIGSKKFELMLSTLLKRNVPEINVHQLKDSFHNYIILDTREIQEFNISHMIGAKNVGFDSFSLKSIADISKNSRIVCYCSVGYRSEKITNQLIEAGYSNVFNLYGSIFEWVNCDYPIVDTQNNQTDKIHTYSNFWGSFISNKKIKKVY